MCWFYETGYTLEMEDITCNKEAIRMSIAYRTVVVHLADGRERMEGGGKYSIEKVLRVWLVIKGRVFTL